jgi:hypothetical protein
MKFKNKKNTTTNKNAPVFINIPVFFIVILAYDIIKTINGTDTAIKILRLEYPKLKSNNSITQKTTKAIKNFRVCNAHTNINMKNPIEAMLIKLPYAEFNGSKLSPRIIGANI